MLEKKMTTSICSSWLKWHQPNLITDLDQHKAIILSFEKQQVDVQVNGTFCHAVQ